MNYLVQILLGLAGQLLTQIFGFLIEKGTFNQVLQLAQAEVNKLGGNTSLDNDQKRAAALTALKSQAKELGIEVGESALNLAIEFAVNAAKAQATSAKKK